MSDWWLDEAAHAGQEHLDASYVAGYERKAGFDPSEDLDSLRRHGFGSDSILVDLGAGTGVFAISAACSEAVNSARRNSVNDEQFALPFGGCPIAATLIKRAYKRLPAILANAGENAATKFLEFFAARILSDRDLATLV